MIEGTILGGIPIRCTYTDWKWKWLGRAMLAGDAIYTDWIDPPSPQTGGEPTKEKS